MEIKKCQLDSRKYEGMGVPIGQGVLEKIRTIPNHAGSYPYLHLGTSMEEYKEALFILGRKQCVTEFECSMFDKTKNTNNTILEEQPINEVIQDSVMFDDTSFGDLC